MARCPHTMKAVDRYGAIHCCDCGKFLGRMKIEPASPHAALSPVQLIRQARVRRKRTDDLRLRDEPSKQPQSAANYQAGFHPCAGY